MLKAKARLFVTGTVKEGTIVQASDTKDDTSNINSGEERLGFTLSYNLRQSSTSPLFSAAFYVQ